MEDFLSWILEGHHFSLFINYLESLREKKSGQPSDLSIRDERLWWIASHRAAVNQTTTSINTVKSFHDTRDVRSSFNPNMIINRKEAVYKI